MEVLVVVEAEVRKVLGVAADNCVRWRRSAAATRESVANGSSLSVDAAVGVASAFATEGVVCTAAS